MSEQTPVPGDRPRKRIIIILAITLAVEIGLVVVVKLGPAMVHIVRPVYVIVAVIGGFTAWHASRRRRGGERRHSDRRGGASE